MLERWARCAGNRLRLGVARVVDFYALRQETFTTALPTPGKSGTAALGAHASAKAVLIFPGALGALQGSFHDVAYSRGATLGVIALLSTVRLQSPPGNLAQPLALTRLLRASRSRSKRKGASNEIARGNTLWNNR